LSKHIKKYHPGHSQDLTPVPLQDDELLNLQQQNHTTTMTSIAKTSISKPSSSSSTTTNAQAIVISNANTNADQADNKLFLPLLPRHPVQQEDLIGFSKDMSSADTAATDTGIDPSLDDNILDLLTEDTDSPMLLSSISPGGGCSGGQPSLPPPPPPPMPPPKTSSNVAAATIVSSKLHEVLTQGRPKTSDQQAFVVPTSMKSNKTTTHIVNLAPVNASTSSSSFKNKPLAISISQVFACAQPLPLQEDAKHGNKGKQTTMADLETRGSASSVLSANAAFVQGLVNARKTGTTIIATSGSGGNIIRTNSGNQQVSIIKPASSTSLVQTLTSSSPSSIHSKAGTHAGIIANSNASKTFVCDFKGCNKSFEKVTFLKRHAKLHSSNCKFVCDVCTKCFESQSKLDDHYRKHTGAKPFICHICGNAFRYKGNAMHLRKKKNYCQ